MIKIEKLNELTIKIICDKSVAMEIYEKFSFFVPGYQYNPKYKNGTWSGQIHFLNLKNYSFPLGLLSFLIRMAKENEWNLSLDRSLKLIDFDDSLSSFIESTMPSLILEPYDYQLETFIKSIKLNRSLVLSPTGCLDENTIIDVDLTEEAKEFLLSIRS